LKCSSCHADIQLRAKFCSECGHSNREQSGVAEITGTQKRPSFLTDGHRSGGRRLKQYEMVIDQMEGSRRQVSVIFTDISGFTSLCERLDPEEATDLVNAYFRRLGAIIDTQEGYIDKFIGDCIMAVFGAPLAHEDDAKRAIQCALLMQKEIKILNEEYDLGLALSIGVNTGPAVAGGIGTEEKLQFTVIGDSVNLAQRFQSLAPPNEIYIGPKTHTLTRDLFVFEEIPNLTIKGKANKLSAFKVLGENEAKNTTFRSNKIFRKTFIQGIAQSVFKSQEDVCIFGPAGIGKSFILDALTRSLQALGKEVLHLRNINKPTEEYATTIRALEKLGLTVDPETSESHRRRYLFNLLKEKLVSKNEIVVLIDNFDQIDPASADIFGNILQLRSRAYRFVIAQTDTPSTIRGLQNLEIATFEPEEALTFIQDLLKDERIDPHLQAYIWEQSHGSPHQIMEVLRSLKNENQISKNSAGVWGLEKETGFETGGHRLQALKVSNFDKLDGLDRDHLELCACLDKSFSMDLLRALIGKDQQASDSLNFLVSENYLQLTTTKTGKKQISFRDASDRAILYDMILLKKRQQIHRNILEKLRRGYRTLKDDPDLEFQSQIIRQILHLDLEALKRQEFVLEILQNPKVSWSDLVHSIQTESPDFASLSTHAFLLRIQGNYSEARGRYEDLLRSLPADSPPDDQLYLKLSYLNCLVQLSEYDRAKSLFNELETKLERTANLQLKIELKRIRAVYYAKKDNWEKSSTIFQEAAKDASQISDLFSKWNFYLSFGLFALQIRKFELAKTLLSESLGLVRNLPALQVLPCYALGLTSFESDQMEDAYAWFEQSLEKAKKLSWSSQALQSTYNRALSAFFQRNLEVAASHFKESIQLAEHLQNRPEQLKSGCLLSYCEYLQSQKPEKLSLFQKLLEKVNALEGPQLVFSIHQTLFNYYLKIGKAPEAKDQLDLADSLAKNLNDPNRISWIEENRARISLQASKA